MEFKQAFLNDLPAVMEVIEDGRELLKKEGNGQWQFGYPNTDTIKNDIENGNCYILCEGDVIVATFAATYYEEDYHPLLEGAWVTDLPYIVMHRCAVRKSYLGKGYGKKMFEAFEKLAISKKYQSLRIDTHANNHPMCKLLLQNGYIQCGRVILPPNKDRIVFEKVLGE